MSDATVRPQSADARSRTRTRPRGELARANAVVEKYRRRPHRSRRLPLDRREQGARRLRQLLHRPGIHLLRLRSDLMPTATARYQRGIAGGHSAELI